MFNIAFNTNLNNYIMILNSSLLLSFFRLLSIFADVEYIDNMFHSINFLKPFVNTPLIIGLFFISLVWNYSRECYWSARNYFTEARKKENNHYMQVL